MKWLDVVKKHAKLNPGKSLKEYLADAQKEYASLKKQGKIDPPKNASGKKSGKKGKKHRGGDDGVSENMEVEDDNMEVEESDNVVEENNVVGGKHKSRSKKGGDFAPNESATKLGSAPVGGSKHRRSKKGGDFAPNESATKLGSAPVGGAKRRRTRKGGKSRSSRKSRSRTARRSKSRSRQ
jgi:hypothetical protein